MITSRRGFTLVELLVSLAIFSVSVVALSSLALSNMSANHVAEDITKATALAEQKIEDLRGASLPPANGTSSDTIGIFTRTWTVAGGPSGTSTKDVTVTMTWGNHGSRSVRLQTLIGR